MKLKILLLLMTLATMSYGQQPNRKVLITEARLDDKQSIFVEITNMGDTSIELSKFSLHRHTPWSKESAILDPWNDTWDTGGFYLPNETLDPGESYVVTTAYDFGPRMYNKRIPGFEEHERMKQPEMYDVADLLIHVSERNGDETDSITTLVNGIEYNYQGTLTTYNGRACYYLKHHYSDTAEAVVDQVNGVFDNNGVNFEVKEGYAVAGLEGATKYANLIRKFSVKNGNLEFVRGVGLDDSEWIAIRRPNIYDSWRDLWWTTGSHGNYVLDEYTLESDVIDVNYEDKILTVPWGIRRLDGIMRHMKRKPGVAWFYHYNENKEDSLYRSVKTGDKLTVYVCGNELQEATFNIEVKEPTVYDNIVIPKAHKDLNSEQITATTQKGILNWPRVTKHESGEDTITGTWHGLPHALRADSLFKYLEKPTNAMWEFVWVDGIERPDLKNGDKLRVISENGTQKEYFIQIQPLKLSHNAYLSSITWPDIPDFYKGIFGWIGDTIPGFNSTSYNYKVEVPIDTEGIPALVARTEDLNASVDVKRATSLTGTSEDRTIAFKVTAEDDSITNTYNVELFKEKDPENIQPFHAEPFLSEFVYMDQYGNGYVEICNPGNQMLDLSNYMVVMQYGALNPADAIQSRNEPNDWLDRYDKYIPGYKWGDEAEWRTTPAILEQDLAVNPYVEPGDVFCMGAIMRDDFVPEWYYPEWPVPKNLDIQFNNFEGQRNYTNPWGEEVSGNGFPCRKWAKSIWYMFKITNDSIKRGLKPATDPNDFELIEAWGMLDGSKWKVDGSNTTNINNFIRKPEIYKGNPDLQGSFGETPEESEWTKHDMKYWRSQNAKGAFVRLNIALDIGQHYFHEPTFYKSTVASHVYKVSEGYSHDEQIRGVLTETSVNEFLQSVIKHDAGQTLKLVASTDGAELAADDVLSMNDTLIVLSADSTNTSKYVLEVTESGLRSDAVLTSDVYEISIDAQPKSTGDESTAGQGTITGFEYGTQLSTILTNINVPDGASLNAINSDGAYVPLNILNFDTVYVKVTVNSDIYLDVLAEDGTTNIVYQLQPTSSENDAFLFSDLYEVEYKNNLLRIIPNGTNVQTLLSNVVASMGASIKLVDKMGFEREEGTVRLDDKIIVTSANGNVQRAYHLSMIPAEYEVEASYLAYVLSDIYAVDQINYIIQGPTGSTAISDFFNRIEPSQGATIIVLDSDGTEKSTSDDLDDGDILMVKSADGLIEVSYQLDLDLTFTNFTDAGDIKLYPNPTDGSINISGLQRGGKVQVFNSTGAVLQEFKINKTVETVSLDNQPAGMYLILVSDSNKLLGRYKVVRK